MTKNLASRLLLQKLILIPAGIGCSFMIASTYPSQNVIRFSDHTPAKCSDPSVVGVPREAVVLTVFQKMNLEHSTICVDIFETLYEKLMSAFDKSWSYQHLSGGCRRISGNEWNIDINITAEPWDTTGISRFREALPKIEGLEINGIRIPVFKKLARIDTINKIGTLIDFKTGGLVEGLPETKAGNSSFLDPVQFCKEIAKHTQIFRNRDFLVPLNDLKTRLDKQTFSRLVSALPEAHFIEFSYWPIFVLSNGASVKVKGHGGEQVERNCTLLSCKP